MKYLDNPHARVVVDLTAQLWQLTPTFYALGKVAELNVPIFTQLPYASPATQSLTKVRTYPRYNAKRCGLRPTSELLHGSTNMAI